MKSWQELKKTKEFWLERIQNDIFRFVKSYMDENGINQSELASHLGVSRGYVSQILNGNHNFSIKKLIELSLKLNIAMDIDFKPLDQFIEEERERVKKIQDKKQEPPNLSVETSRKEQHKSLNKKQHNHLKK